MNDQDFKDEFKPVHVPAHFADCHTWDDKIFYALAQLGQATALEVADKLIEIDSEQTRSEVENCSESILKDHFKKGLIKGHLSDNHFVYNLSKIEKSNKGNVNPGLLTEGLD
ncbi:hypothetical protein [Hufsiella arboris]|nr:hypothetical protein [Hufsiella arboris]